MDLLFGIRKRCRNVKIGSGFLIQFLHWFWTGKQSEFDGSGNLSQRSKDSSGNLSQRLKNSTGFLSYRKFFDDFYNKSDSGNLSQKEKIAQVS